eukprot:jgi/Undpi1/173/HiC_scaffold_1.g00170.m1
MAHGEITIEEKEAPSREGGSRCPHPLAYLTLLPFDSTFYVLFFRHNVMSLEDRLGSSDVEYYEGLGSLNLGVSGDQTQHLLWRMQNGELPDVLQPQSIMVAIGTNNLGYGMSAEDTVGGIKAVVKDLREQRPDALIVVIGLFPRASYKTRTDTTPWEIIDEPRSHWRVNSPSLSVFLLRRSCGSPDLVCHLGESGADTTTSA